MGMAIISDRVLTRLRKIQYKWLKTKPKLKERGKITYSVIIDKALDKLKEGV